MLMVKTVILKKEHGNQVFQGCPHPNSLTLSLKCMDEHGKLTLTRAMFLFERLACKIICTHCTNLNRLFTPP